MEVAVVFISLFVGIFLSIYFYQVTRHRERMSLIENGADAKLFQSDARKKPYFFAMLLGILFISVALGIGVGHAIHVNWVEDSFRNRDNPVAYFISIFFFIGLGFMAAYMFHKKELQKEN